MEGGQTSVAAGSHVGKGIVTKMTSGWEDRTGASQEWGTGPGEASGPWEERAEPARKGGHGALGASHSWTRELSGLEIQTPSFPLKKLELKYALCLFFS